MIIALIWDSFHADEQRWMYHSKILVETYARNKAHIKLYCMQYPPDLYPEMTRLHHTWSDALRMSDMSVCQFLRQGYVHTRYNTTDQEIAHKAEKRQGQKFVN